MTVSNQASFFNRSKQPYYIWALGYDYKQQSAGMRALHLLCHVLNEMGCEAYLVGAKKSNEKLRTPILTEKDVLAHFALGLRPICVYPEVVTGNPLNIPQVVRWVLNKPGHLGGDEHFDDSELVFTFSSSYVPEGCDYSILRLPLVDTSIFNNLNNPHDSQRQGACYYAHKYFAYGGELTPEAEGATSLCQDVRLSHHELAQILRRSECLYAYEPSAIIGEALMCGCPVIMVPSAYLDECLTHKIADMGIASSTSEEDIAYAKRTVRGAWFKQIEVQKECRQFIANFIEESQQHFSAQPQSQDKEWLARLLSVVKGQSKHDHKVAQLPRTVNQQAWLKHSLISENKVANMAQRMMTRWHTLPSFHLIIVVNASELVQLSETLDSLQQQLYQAWGLTILANVPAPPAFTDVPDNIEWIQCTDSLNAVIEQAVNDAGLDWVMQLLPGDRLMPHALMSFAETINQEPDKCFIYSDELLNEVNADIVFKPDFNLDLLHSNSYIGRACMVRRDSFELSGGYTAFAYVYVTDLAFKIYEAYGEAAFSHIPQVLYHAAPNNIDADLLLANEIKIRQGHFLRRGLPVNLTHPAGKPRFQVQYLAAEPCPPVTIVIAERNQVNALAHCVEILFKLTDYPNFELVIVDADSDVEDMQFVFDELTSLAPDRIRVVKTAHSGHAQAVNEGIRQANFEFVVVMSVFTMTPNANWLTQLVNLSSHPEMGLVGTRVIDEDKTVIHAGTVLGQGDDVFGLFYGEDVAAPGYMDRAHCIQQYSSVSSACYLGSKSHILSVGGLDEDLTESRHAVVDLSLKLQHLGLKVLWTPYATVVQDGALAQASNGVDAYEPQEQRCLERWSEVYANDPYFHPSLSLRSAEFEVENQIVFDGGSRFKDVPRVIVFPLNESGTGRYRCIDPLHQLERQCLVEVVWLPTHELKTEPFLPNQFEVNRLRPDVVFIQQALSDKHFDYFKQLKERSGLPFVFSLDDLLMSLPDQSNRKSLVFHDMRHRLRRTLALCDRLIVTTATLAEAYAEYIEDIYVIPNALELSGWQAAENTKTSTQRKPRVGWAGATQHSGDLAMLNQVVIDLADEVDWVFMGMCPDELKSVVAEVHPFVSFENYPAALAHLDLDLAIAPLEDNAFNRSKSNLRLLEYGINGWPVIASRVTPYLENNPPVTLVDNSYQSWVTAIKAAISEQDKIAASGSKLKNWVLGNYTLEAQLPLWLRAISF